MRRRGRNFRPVGFMLLAAGCSVAAISPARGQQVRPAGILPAVPGQADEDRVQASPPSDGLPDILVTARRRPEPLQRTPVSVVALSGEDLEVRSVTNLRSLQNFVPNVTFAPSQNVGEAAGNLFIRGIGQEDFAAAAEPGVAFYVDGVYIARTTGTLMNLVDVARVEVLRGPQGTLFGRNSIGGAVNLVSNLPRSEREGRFSLILGNYDRVELRAVLNEPLSSRLFVRLSAGMVQRDGYLRRLPPPVPLEALAQVSGARADSRREGDDHDRAVRLQLRWLVSPVLTADISLDGSRKRNRQGATHLDAIDPRFGIFPTLNRLIREGKLPGPEIVASLPPANLLQSYASGRNATGLDTWGVSAVIARQLGAGTLKFIGAYRGLRSRVETDTDGLYFDIAESEIRVNQRQFSGELQLSGVKGALSYTAGLFAFREEIDLLPGTAVMNRILVTCGCFYTPRTFPLLTTEPRRLGSRSYAGYAQGTYRIAGGLSVTLGARYSRESKTIRGQAFRLDANLQPTNLLVATGSNRDGWNSLTWRAGLEYQATRNLMAYGSVARGYKSGGFNARSSAELPNLGFIAFKPETALTWELGLRSEWLDRRLRLNATVFHTDYRDIQLRRQTLVDGVAATLIENAAKARIRGAELELTAAPAKGLTLSAAYGRLAPRYLDVGRVPGLTPSSRFQRTPGHSFSAALDYAMPVAAGTLQFHADYGYRSREQFQIVAALNDQPGYGLLGARLSFRTRGDLWSFAMFGTNLTDERYRTAGRGTSINQAGIAFSSIGLPRQLGVQATTRF